MKGNLMSAILMLLLSADIIHAEANYVNVKEYGAKGDGSTDDSQAIKKALDSLPDAGGTIYFPPGHYLTDTIKGKSFTTFKGDSAWGYKRESKGNTIISPVKEKMFCLFDLNGSIGTRLVGLTLLGMECSNEIHGVYSKHADKEQNIVIDDCKITRFTGSGVRLDNTWVFAIRHSLIMGNMLSGIDATGSYDGWIIDNQITANKRYGIYGDPLSAVTITANRIEWNHGGGIIIGKNTYVAVIQIANCMLDRNFGPGIGITLTNTNQTSYSISITGNMFRRNGFKRDDEPEASSHLVLHNLKGVSVTGNTMYGDLNWSDKKYGYPQSPKYGILIEGLVDSIVANNSLYHCATDQIIFDKGNHQNSVITANQGSLSPKK